MVKSHQFLTALRVSNVCSLAGRKCGKPSNVMNTHATKSSAIHIRQRTIVLMAPWLTFQRFEAFDVKPGDEYYIPPEERVTIW